MCLRHQDACAPTIRNVGLSVGTCRLRLHVCAHNSLDPPAVQRAVPGPYRYGNLMHVVHCCSYYR